MIQVPSGMVIKLSRQKQHNTQNPSPILPMTVELRERISLEFAELVNSVEADSKGPFYSILRDAYEVTWHFLRSK